jgi:CheY-like chemotaxis protein
VVEGPRVLLQPTPAQTLALALHELATNAAKYGALSCVAGQMRLIWEIKDGNLQLRWTETGGPAAKQASSPGFGTRIIFASVEGQLGGKVRFDWRPDGLECLLSVPLNDKLAPPEHASSAPQNWNNSEASAEAPTPISANRVLILEDEALVAMAMNDLMTELGFTVVGPFGKMQDAMAELKKGGVDAAMLDINLGGQLVYPLADVLLSEGVPFVFVTGYEAESIDRRFANVPVLQKPLERQSLQRIFREPQQPELAASRRGIGQQAMAS